MAVCCWLFSVPLSMTVYYNAIVKDHYDNAVKFRNITNLDSFIRNMHFKGSPNLHKPLRIIHVYKKPGQKGSGVYYGYWTEKKGLVRR